MFFLLLTLLLLPCSAAFAMDHRKFHSRIQDQINAVQALCEMDQVQPRQQQPPMKNVAATLFAAPAHVSTQEIHDRIEGSFDELKASHKWLQAPVQQVNLPRINNFDDRDSEIVELHSRWLRIQPQQSNLRPINNFDESDSELSELHKRLMLQKKLQQ